MVRLLRFLKSLTGPTMQVMALSSICYAGSRYAPRGRNSRVGDTDIVTLTIWIPFAVGCLLASHDARNFK